MTRDIENYEKQYQEHRFEDVMVKYRRKVVLRILQKYKAKNILEIGCGNAPIFEYYPDFNSMTVVEPALVFFNNLTDKSKLFPEKKITMVHGFLENVYEKLAANSYDFILVSGLLHEVDSPELLLNLISNLCGNDTVVHINVPNKNSFHRMLALKSKIIDSLDQHSDSQIRLQQKDFFDMESLTQLIGNAGFTSIDQGSYFLKLFTHTQMDQILSNNIINDKILNGLFEILELFPEYGAEIFMNMRLKIK